MTIEADPTSSAVFPDALNASYPAGTDKKKEGDNHIRLVKKVVKNTFPNINGAVTPTEEKLNLLTPGYFAWSDTIANCASLPLRLDVSDAAGATGSCGIQFETADGTGYISLYEEQNSQEMQFQVTEPIRVTHTPVDTSWYSSGLQVYCPSGAPRIALTSPASGSVLTHNAGAAELRVTDNTGAVYRNLRAGRVASVSTASNDGTWDTANIVIYAYGTTPMIGMGGSSYGGSLRVSQSDGAMEVVNGNASTYTAFRSAGQTIYGDETNYGSLTVQNVSGSVSPSINYLNSVGRSSYEYGSSDASYYYHNIVVGDAAAFVFRHDGYAYATAQWIDLSDKNYKENLKEIGGALGKVQQLQGYTFNYKGSTEPTAGIIAQDLQKVLPEAVFTHSAGIKEPNTEMLGVGYSGVSALLVEAVKELAARLEAAEARIAQLDKRGGKW